MPKFKVSANETLYYLSKEVEAKDSVEAEEIYLQMLDDGKVEVNDRDLREVNVEEIK